MIYLCRFSIILRGGNHPPLLPRSLLNFTLPGFTPASPLSLFRPSGFYYAPDPSYLLSSSSSPLQLPHPPSPIYSPAVSPVLLSVTLVVLLAFVFISPANPRLSRFNPPLPPVSPSCLRYPRYPVCSSFECMAYHLG